MRIVAVVVVYNKKCSESISLKGLDKYGSDIDVVVFDNSTTDFGNEQYCRNRGYKYFTEKKNIGLSKAYNYVISQIECDYVMILDDDTELNKKYFDGIKKIASKLKYDIILPIVKAGNMIISPSVVQFGCRVNKIRNVNEIDIRKITAINSGMVVAKRVYDKIMYNEEIFLDYVDHDFMREIRENRFSIKVMTDVIILQSFSMVEKSDLMTEKGRREIYKKDFGVYCKNCKRRIFYHINIWQYNRRLKKKYGEVK